MEIEAIKEKISELPRKEMTEKDRKVLKRYLGSGRNYYGAKTADVLKIAKEVASEQEEFSITELRALFNTLFLSNNLEEYFVGGKVFTLLTPTNRKKILFNQLEDWLSKARGWVEVDVICQSSFGGQEVLDGWQEWEKAIKKFSKSDLISLRRASLVLQTRSNREIKDSRMRQLAFETIDLLKHEKDILITKAVSWLLRSLTFQDKEEVRRYLLSNENTLPRIAFRETMKKIETGKKTPRREK